LCVLWSQLRALTVNVQVNWTLARCVIGDLRCDVTLLQRSRSLLVQFIDIENNCNCNSNWNKITETETKNNYKCNRNCKWKITSETRHRASTSTRWHFAFGAMLSWQQNPCTDCKFAQSAQLEGTPYHSPDLHTRPCGSVGLRRGTDRHTDARDQYRVVYRTYAKYNNSPAVLS